MALLSYFSITPEIQKVLVGKATNLRADMLNLRPFVGVGQVGQDVGPAGNLFSHLSRPLVSRNRKRARRRGRIISWFTSIEPASSRPYHHWLLNGEWLISGSLSFTFPPLPLEFNLSCPEFAYDTRTKSQTTDR